MFTAKIRNQYGEVLELTHNPNYTVTSITGLGPVSASVNTSALASADGSRLNSSRKTERNIVITVVINGNIEKNRLALYQYAPTKYPIRLYFKNESRDAYIDGIVESHEIDHFENRQAAQISIICPDPAFKSTKETFIDLSYIEPMFEFWFSIEDEGIEFSTVNEESQKSIISKGEMETGVFIEMRATGVVENPVIFNRITREKFALNFTMQDADVIRINTNRGEKSVTLIRDGIETNILNYADAGNSWFVIRHGDNVFTYNAAVGYEFLQVRFSITDQYEGV